jgi:hypothetical protein
MSEPKQEPFPYEVKHREQGGGAQRVYSNYIIGAKTAYDSRITLGEVVEAVASQCTVEDRAVVTQTITGSTDTGAGNGLTVTTCACGTIRKQSNTPSHGWHRSLPVRSTSPRPALRSRCYGTSAALEDWSTSRINDLPATGMRRIL